MTEDEMDGQCSQSYQHGSDQSAGGSGRQECLACSGPWGHEESDTTKRLNNNNNNNRFRGCTGRGEGISFAQLQVLMLADVYLCTAGYCPFVC